MPIFFQITKTSFPVSIASIGNHWKQENIHRQDGYPHYHWLQSESGSGSIHIDGNIIELHPRQGILIKPFTPHSYHSKDLWYTKFVTFNGTLSDNFDKIVGKDKYILSADSEHFSYHLWIDNIIEKHLSKTKNQREIAIEGYAFLLQLASMNQVDHFSNLEDENYKNYVYPTILKLETQYDQSLSLDVLANELFISPQYLSRVFKKYTKETIVTYLQNIRVNKAKELLINHPSLKIQEVVDFCGFSDCSYFISLFKHHTGYTPLQFRKLYLIQKNET